VASEGSHNTVGVADPDPIIGPGHTFETVTDKISAIVLTRPITPGWVFGLLISFGALMLLNMVVTLLMIKGVGIWGIKIPPGALPSSISSGGLVSVTPAP